MSREQVSSVPYPPDSLWVFTDLIMEYMCHRFHAELFPTTDLTSILPDINKPTKIVCEMDQMSEIMSLQESRYTCLSKPAILIMESGEMITWYLPAAERVWEFLKHIKISLPQNVGQSIDTKKWQTDSTLFWRDAKLVGIVNLLPAWLQ
ncbi:hypothetical protein PAXRUDRAFT_155440 [Paxillus rubicundulus Ve08.2h10]|uniref:Uncharacterized protein n=1 Tax=Paxillus rubicundulus Ve08.2h10 TaxID=930991 RepID=A0A0D0DC28_9AGAM|nr:hypothetical protein PAXRUDRAFT_155440 [Paxillus rubicundulus Ve08.2h10]